MQPRQVTLPVLHQCKSYSPGLHFTRGSLRPRNDASMHSAVLKGLMCLFLLYSVESTLSSLKVVWIRIGTWALAHELDCYCSVCQIHQVNIETIGISLHDLVGPFTLLIPLLTEPRNYTQTLLYISVHWYTPVLNLLFLGFSWIIVFQWTNFARRGYASRLCMPSIYPSHQAKTSTKASLENHLGCCRAREDLCHRSSPCQFARHKFHFNVWIHRVCGKSLACFSRHPGERLNG